MTEPANALTVADIYRKIVISHPEDAPKCKTDPYVVYGLEGVPILELFRMIRNRCKAVHVSLRFGADVYPSSSWDAVHSGTDAKYYSKFLIDAPEARGLFAIGLTSGTLDIEVVKIMARLSVCTTDAVYSNVLCDLTAMLDTIVGPDAYTLGFWPGDKVANHDTVNIGLITVNANDLVELGVPEPPAEEVDDASDEPKAVVGDLRLHAVCECDANVYVPVTPLQLFAPVETECGVCGRHLTIAYPNPN